jgi:hypothetical protein
MVSCSSLELKKTRAKPGEGTGIRQTLFVASQGILVTLRSPRKRPSTLNFSPNVYK